jgi:hypothetical protein
MTQSHGELILRRLSTGEAGPILVADFQAMSMAPRLSEMLSEFAPDQSVFQIDPVRVLSGKRLYVPLPELAAACAGDFLGPHAGDSLSPGPEDDHVCLVGHCSAAPLALRVAGLLAATRPVTAVLLNPTWPDDDHVAAKFAEFLTRFGTASRPCPDLDANPDRVVSAMAQLLHDEMMALAASRGVTGSAGAFSDLLVWYRAWLAFLLAGRNDSPIEAAAGRAAVTVLSDSPSAVTVPGLSQDAYRLFELPPQPVGTVTRELAEVVAAHVVRH